MGKSKVLDKKQAELLFVEQGYIQKDIVAELNVAERIVNRWSTEGCWKEKRQAKLMSKKATIESVAAAISLYSNELNNAGQPPTIKDMLALASAVKALNELEGENSFYISCEALQGFAKYVLSVNPMLAKELAPVIDAYLKDLLNYKT